MNKNKELFISSLINFVWTVIKALTYGVSCFVAWRIFDLLDIVDIRKEITQNKNIGWAIMIGALFFGLAYVIGQF
ncbi:MAG: DUF350 domain-containing protein [Chitinivibrionales bacterium]|nr:DUF350 domain-containing protein [Chitinivibrionales bacterium]